MITEQTPRDPSPFGLVIPRLPHWNLVATGLDGLCAFAHTVPFAANVFSWPLTLFSLWRMTVF